MCNVSQLLGATLGEGDGGAGLGEGAPVTATVADTVPRGMWIGAAPLLSKATTASFSVSVALALHVAV